MMERTAVYFGSRQIYADMVSAVKSLLYHNGADKVWLLIEDDEFPYELPENGIVQVRNISKLAGEIFKPNGPNWNSEWTYVGLIRAALTKVFPDLDTVLSIDCDTIVDADISGLWELPMADYYLAGVREPTLSGRDTGLYINAGVTMFNLKKLREESVDEEMISALNNYRFYFVAQDVMNAYCKGHILKVSGDYNCCAYTEPAKTKRIIHYAGNRGSWRHEPIVQQYRDMAWEEVLEARNARRGGGAL